MSIEVKNLSLFYVNRQVLHDISFSVEKGTLLSVLGHNGAGKSSLFRCILGLEKSYTGQVFIDGANTRSLSTKEMAKHIAYIPQSSSPAFNYSAFDIVLMGTTSSLRGLDNPKKEDCERVWSALDKLGICHLASRCYHRLSGGEQQLVLIARALSQNAGILMLDEPAASLDFGNQLMLMRHARELADEGYTVIQTTHNPEQSYMFSDRIICIGGGRILRDGRPKDILDITTVRELYGENVHVLSLFDDRARVCIPDSIVSTSKSEMESTS